MKSNEVISDSVIQVCLSNAKFTIDADEGRLMLAELLLKANAGFYNSHTEENFLRACRVQKSDRTANKAGRRFLCSMLYADSNGKPDYYRLMAKYRY